MIVLEEAPMSTPKQVAHNKEGLEKFKQKVKAFAEKTAAAQPAQVEPAEETKLKVQYEPPVEEITLSSIKTLYHIMTGEVLTIIPELVTFPPNDYEEIKLVKSSIHHTYYRVTPNSCQCAGWFWSVHKYGVGKCRHHTLAFKEQAAENCKRIAEIKLGITQGEASASSASLSMAEKIQLVEETLKHGGIEYRSIDRDTMGEGSIMIRLPYIDDPTPEDAQTVERALSLCRAAIGSNQVYASAM
jgi:hypothetical protein